MTCLEKYMMEHPEKDPDKLIRWRCPHDSGGTDIPQPYYCNPRDVSTCGLCWGREVPDNEPDPTPTIKDSGSRTEFDTGAVRDIQKGKGRCDLMPLDVVASLLCESPLGSIAAFQQTGDHALLENALCAFDNEHYKNFPTMFLEVAKHFEEGAEKYGENNWQKGIPVRCYIDSAVRHYLKWLRGDKDEPHDRAFCWNILCAIWTCKHLPELNEYSQELAIIPDGSGKNTCITCGAVIPDNWEYCNTCWENQNV